MCDVCSTDILMKGNFLACKLVISVPHSPHAITCHTSMSTTAFFTNPRAGPEKHTDSSGNNPARCYTLPVALQVHQHGDSPCNINRQDQ